ncbi:hypothetical protein QFC22_005723 [Naganishia vaughanmartiniae]|uniref:Uncharacterized protein n=1 Tax=Naganishia vaughanmartiniae TaxID=1424756 RepID=A0ACC2WT40_9TREE|nr:hypothetical protein QFC22_005723 [Naganishia vaughanmartiniae]
MFKNLFRKDTSPKRSPLTVDIQLQNFGIVVHPGDTPDASASSNENTMVSGVATLSSDPSIIIRSIRVAFMIEYRHRRPGMDTWTQGILHEHGETFIHGLSETDAIDVCYSEDGGVVRRRIDFGMLIAKDIATYERLPHARISPQIRVSVEFDYADWPPNALRALPVAPPVYVDDGTFIPDQHRFVSEIWSGGSVIPKDVPVVSESSITSGSISPGSAVPHQVQTWIKIFFINANPDPTSGPLNLRIHKRGVAAGIGTWNAFIWSDSFSVGSYIHSRLDFSDMSPACRIYSVELHIVQTYSAVPIEEYKIGVYDPEEYLYPSDTVALHKAGEKPSTNRPGKDTPTLWQGSRSEISEGAAAGLPLRDGERYTWETEKIRLPVAAHIRPSTCDGTKSPIHIKHKFVVKVYFSVTGETLDGRPIDDEPGTGELRLLIVNLPQHLPACVCVSEWVTLPGYDESNKAESAPNVPLCACCYATEQFPSSTFDEAFPAEQLEERATDVVSPTDLKSPVNPIGGGRTL